MARNRREQHSNSAEPRTHELWEVLAEEFTDSGRQLSDDFQNLKAEYEGTEQPSPRDAKRHELETQLFSELHASGRTALCFSGGGVRSATFGLGVLQGLAAHSFEGGEGTSPLAEFDYLSTVSGGGYLGSWFSAWAKRDPNGPQGVVKELGKKPQSVIDPEPEPLLHLRKYCAFLDPKLGLLSADSWTLASIIARNMVLNWLILIPLLMLALLPPSIYRRFLDARDAQSTTALLILGALAVCVATAYITFQLPAFRDGRGSGEDVFIGWALLPLMIAAMALSLHWFWIHQPGYSNYSLGEYAGFGAAVHTAGWVLGLVSLTSAGRLTKQSWLGKGAIGLIGAAGSGTIAGGLGYLVSSGFDKDFAHKADLYACLAVPAILGAVLTAVLFLVGFVSRCTGDEDREWWARAGAWVMIAAAAWMVATATVIYGPSWMQKGWARLSAAVASAGLGGMASWIGFSPSTSAAGREDKSATQSSPLKDAAAALIGPLFLWSLMVLLAYAIGLIHPNVPWQPRSLWLAAGLLALALIGSYFVNVNRFSLHAMYRDRLIRTYLGASRPGRAKSVNPFIDMDDRDNVMMKDLSRDRPLHVVNMTLNLVGGENLAWQQRKAESFTASRLHTGSLRVGYQRTRDYGGADGITLGAAVAISGAAASPNMGYHSSPVITLIMTLFNARLGWWLANPGKGGKGTWHKDGPRFAVRPIIDEALGRTDDQSRWIYLSDGGHFENLGVYEMVLRRCRTIVVVDGSEDAAYNFEDLGNAVRKVRVDLGIDIEFKDDIPIYGRIDPRNRYCAIGQIRYDRADHSKDGQILYIKACLNRSEPRDVSHYAASKPPFPQQGTEQLWFDEAQFESYRRLGLHIMNCLHDSGARAVPAGKGRGTERIFVAARAHLAASIPSGAAAPA